MGQDIYKIENELPETWKFFYYAVADAYIIERQKEALASKPNQGGGSKKTLKPPPEFRSRG